METIITKIGAIIIAISINIAGFLGFVPNGEKVKNELDFKYKLQEYEERIADYENRLNLVNDQFQNLSAIVPRGVAFFSTTLALKISSTATSLTLSTGTDKAGTNLSGYMCFVISEGETNEETVCGTASGTSVTSLIRGISPVDGDLEVTALKKEHARGSSVKVTDHPQLVIISRILNGDETIPNAIKYASEPSWSYGTNQLVSYDEMKDYSDALSIAGAPNGNTTTKGIFELATTAESLLGTATGSTGAYLCVANSLLNQTSSAKNIVPVTDTNGKLSQAFFNLSDNFTWTGTHRIPELLATTSASIAQLTVNGTTTFVGVPSYAADPVSDNDLVRKSYVDPKPVSAAGSGNGTPYTSANTTTYAAPDPEFSKSVSGLTAGDVLIISYGVRLRSQGGGNVGVKFIDATNNKDILSEVITSGFQERAATVTYIAPSSGTINFQIQYKGDGVGSLAQLDNLTNATTLSGRPGFLIMGGK